MLSHRGSWLVVAGCWNLDRTAGAFGLCGCCVAVVVVTFVAADVADGDALLLELIAFAFAVAFAVAFAAVVEAGGSRGEHPSVKEMERPERRTSGTGGTTGRLSSVRGAEAKEEEEEEETSVSLSLPHPLS